MKAALCGFFVTNFVVVVFFIYTLTVGSIFLTIGVKAVGIVCLIISFVTILFLILGYIGLICVNRTCLFLYIALTSCLFLAHIIFIAILNGYYPYEKYIEMHLLKIFRDYKDTFHAIERSYVCCGIYDWQDYAKKMDIPVSCCGIQGKITTQCKSVAKNRAGCKDKMQSYYELLKQRTVGFAVFMLFVYIYLIILAAAIYNYRYKRRASSTISTIL